MKQIKQLTFNITQSRRIKNYSQKMKISEKEILSKYQKVMHIIFHAWKKNYGDSQELSFREFFLSVMKFAEFASRLNERKDELTKIKDHVKILEEALIEYDSDFNIITNLEKRVKEYSGRVT